jgi:cytochrome c oxidase subunit 2
MRQAARAISLVLVASLSLAGCNGVQSALDPQGPSAETLAWLFWIFLAVLAPIWLATNFAMLLALRKRKPETDPLAIRPQDEQRMVVVVGAAVGLTAVTVVALTLFSFSAQSALFSGQEGALTMKVTGHQWWWEVTYENSDPQRVLTTANEIHIPVGEPVYIKLESSDVIHSFWIPKLAGKLDLIPGRQNQLRIQADAPGVYRGQCAEFCGWQHAKMAMLVVAHEPEGFRRWMDQQLAPAAVPTDSERKRGMEVFVNGPCALCHQIRGTKAGGRVAPDLTHIGSRRTIAAGTLPNNRGNLAAWFIDPQRIKPGANMPTIPLPAADVGPLAAYLEGLK